MATMRECLVGALASDGADTGVTLSNEEIEALLRKKEDSETAGIIRDFDKKIAILQNKGVNIAEAEARATSDAMTALAEIRQARNTEKLRNAQKMLSIQKQMMSSKKGLGRSYKEDVITKVKNVEDGLFKEFGHLMDDFLEQYKATWGGLHRSKEHVDDMVDVLVGRNRGSNKAANELADVFLRYRQHIRERAAVHGVSLPDPKENGPPQVWNRAKLSIDDSRAKFIDDHMADGMLDWERMSQVRGARADMVTNMDARREFLGKAYTSLLIKGSDTASIAERMTQSRKIIFKDGDAWRRSQKNWGQGNAVEQILVSMRTDAQMLAQLEVLGTKPRQTLEHVKRATMADLVEKSEGLTKKEIAEIEAKAEKDGKTKDETKAIIKTIRDDRMSGSKTKARADEARTGFKLGDTMFGMLSGEFAPDGGGNKVAEWFIGAIITTPRIMMTPFRLNNTIVAATITDTNLAKATRLAHDMKSDTSALRLLDVVGRMNKKELKRFGMLNEMAFGILDMNDRQGSDFFGPKFAQHFAELGMRAQGLTGWTENARSLALLDIGSTMQRDRGKKFSELFDHESMVAHGITEADWDKVRALEPTVSADGSIKAITLSDIDRMRVDAKTADEAYETGRIFTAFASYQFELLEKLVPTASLEARTVLTRGSQAGTFAGESLRSSASFMNWPLSVTLQMQKDWMDKAGMDRAKYLGARMSALTFSGALIIAVNDIRETGELRDPLSFSFLANAANVGSPIPLAPDLVTGVWNSVANERFGGVDDVIGGNAPADFLDDVLGGIGRTTVRAAGSDSVGEAAGVVANTAGMTALELTGVAHTGLQRLWNDYVSEAIDPKGARQYNKKKKRQRKRLEDATGSKNIPVVDAAMGMFD